MLKEKRLHMSDERFHGWRLVAAWVFILGICAAFYYGIYSLLVWVFS